MSNRIIHCAGQLCPHLLQTKNRPPKGKAPYTDYCTKAGRELGRTAVRLGYAPDWCPFRGPDGAAHVDPATVAEQTETNVQQKKASAAKKPATRSRTTTRKSAPKK